MQLFILPGNPPPKFIYRENYNRGYQFFKKTWERIFNRPNRPKHYDPMGYFRQSYIFQIEEDEKVVCQTLATHYHLDNNISHDLPFMEKFKGVPMEYLQEEGIRSCLSLEYSSIGREYSPKRQEGLNFYKVIFDLAVRYAKELEVGAIIGHPRRLTKSNDIITEIGCRMLQTDERKYGVSVDVSIGVIRHLGAFDDPQVQFAVKKFWNERNDTIGITSENAEPYKNQFLREKHKHIGAA